MDSGTGQRRADLVLEGGGVKGIALVGAVLGLAGAGYRFPRVAGTSAGAVVGAVLAGLEQRGEDASRLADIALTLDYRRFRDRGFPGNLLGPLGFLSDGVAVLLEDGAYEGDYLEDWLRGVLADLGVHTFGDLRTGDPEGERYVEHRYRLVVTASDISRRRLVQLPWDFADYGLDPDEQSVAWTVRASSSIPYFFEPVTLRSRLGTSTLVDGGLVANYPIEMFDRPGGDVPRWPTLGVRLDALGTGAQERTARRVRGPVAMGVALVETALRAGQAEQTLDPCNLSRSIDVETGAVSAVDFSLTDAQQRALVEAGRRAAGRFLQTWDFGAWVAGCRDTGRSARANGSPDVGSRSPVSTTDP